MSLPAILGHAQDYSIDIFSLGVCFYQSLTFRYPFPTDIDQPTLVARIQSRQFQRIPRGGQYSDLICDIVEGMLMSACGTRKSVFNSCNEVLEVIMNGMTKSISHTNNMDKENRLKSNERSSTLPDKKPSHIICTPLPKRPIPNTMSRPGTPIPSISSLSQSASTTTTPSSKNLFCSVPLSSRSPALFPVYSSSIPLHSMASSCSLIESRANHYDYQQQQLHYHDHHQHLRKQKSMILPQDQSQQLRYSSQYGNIIGLETPPVSGSRSYSHESAQPSLLPLSFPSISHTS